MALGSIRRQIFSVPEKPCRKRIVSGSGIKIWLIISAIPQHLVVSRLHRPPNQQIFHLRFNSGRSAWNSVKTKWKPWTCGDRLPSRRQFVLMHAGSDGPPNGGSHDGASAAYPAPVRGLASALNVGKPAITRALDTLSRLGFVQRRRDPKDGRNVFVERTEKGDAFLDMLGSTILQGDVIEQRPILAAVS
ncbi:MAG: MarR family transcriptional regulator [Hyphomonadaceae bacterium]